MYILTIPVGTPVDPLYPGNQKYQSQGPPLNSDHRYQGFPGGGFEKPRERISSGSRSRPDDLSTREETKYGLRQNFNPR